MKRRKVDLMIVGAGPVGLMCAALAYRCGLTALIVDGTAGPIQAGRADAFNARTLQLLELDGVFAELYPLGKTCNTSSVWANGQFISRQSSWWQELEGCFHKHFLMLGQSHLEQVLDQKLHDSKVAVRRATRVLDIQLQHDGCVTTLSDGELIHSKYVIGADGSRSFVREHFQIPFEITRPELIWAVIDGVIETDFPKVPEIIVFQAETSDVAWIPREGNLDRFYVRMDRKDFSQADAVKKIQRAVHLHHLDFRDIIWYSQFSVKESVAEKFALHDRVFLTGDACHIHSVNGGQGLNTGLGDAFNLIWKINMVLRHKAAPSLLGSYERERKPIAQSVVETSAELVRATKFSKGGTHAQDYLEILQRRSGHITGMGIRYGASGLSGQRLFDFEVQTERATKRIYCLLDYTKFTLLIFGVYEIELKVPENVQVLNLPAHVRTDGGSWSEQKQYENQAVLVRPDSYIAAIAKLEAVGDLVEHVRCLSIPKWEAEL